MNFPTPFGFQAGNGPDGNEFSKAMRAWGTPRSPTNNGVGCGDPAKARLEDQAAAFPTPKASTGGADPDSRPTGKNLANVAADFLSSLPPETTPQAGLGSSPTAPTSGPSFFATPTVALGMGGHIPSEKSREKGGNRSLNRDLAEMGLALQNEIAIAYGLSGTDASPLLNRHLRPSRFTAKLNPNFVDWLMGWPPGWSIAQIGFALPETASFRSRQHTPSPNSGDDLETTDEV